MDKEVVVLRHNGISLSHEINVIRLVAAGWVDLGTMTLSEISHREKDTYPKISLIEGMSKSLHLNWITKQNRVTHLENTLWLLNGKGEVGWCIKQGFEISSDTVPQAKYVIDKTYSLLSELDSTPPIHRPRIYLTRKSLKTYVLISLWKWIKRV